MVFNKRKPYGQYSLTEVYFLLLLLYNIYMASNGVPEKFTMRKGDLHE